jgi:glycine/D-amino acid oxidase-like deaminating enzyme
VTVLWQDGPAPPPRAALPGHTAVDVAIVGAGYTGLWTAYHLVRRDPRLRIAVVEREVAGFGASGRNGGWCSALFPASWARLDRESGPGAVRAMQAALESTVDDVGRVAAAEGIDCRYAKGGSVSLVRNAAQLARARHEVEDARRHGFGPDTLDLVGPDEARRRVGAAGVLGAVTTRHCAALDPARLVRGLAEAVERRGVRLYERTAALSVAPGSVVTTHGTVRADVVLPATEGYTGRLRRRELVPVYSLMLATEPLPGTVWARLGLRDRATFTDGRHLTIYGQRTADGRIAFGGRGAPYHFGSRVSPSYDRVARVHSALREVLVDLFPELSGVAITHRWGGALGVPRDWYPSVGYDPRTGLAWAGGYVGDGVATSFLAGRTVADLVLGHDTELTRLPWVRRRTRRWEPEPLRWAGVNAVTALMAHADRTEARTGRPSRAAAAFWRALGN